VCGLELECQVSLIYHIYVSILVESSVCIGARMSREFDIKLICRYTSGE
jgi:hypothetical protein